jgi:hypothetical protein
MPDLVSSWVMSVFVGVLGLVGLLMAANARDAAIYGFGLGVFVFAILFVFFIVKRAFDAAAADKA